MDLFSKTSAHIASMSNPCISPVEFASDLSSCPWKSLRARGRGVGGEIRASFHVASQLRRLGKNPWVLLGLQCRVGSERPPVRAQPNTRLALATPVVAEWHLSKAK